MCLIAFAWQSHPRYSLVLAGNRDEFHARPTAALARWAEQPQVLAGRDLLAQGSWLGVSERGHAAAVTNVRLPAEARSALRSRGELVRSFLSGDEAALDAATRLAPELTEYGACNLLLFDGRDAIYAGNQPKAHWQSLPPGVYGLSNASIDSPWPKTLALKSALQSWLQQADDEDFSRLFAALKNEHRADDTSLPDTGVGLELERVLSPAFIRGETYGTRCSSVLAIGHDGRGVIEEHRFGPNAAALGSTRLEFRWPMNS